MNFQGLKRVESDKFYFGVAITRTNQKAEHLRGRKYKGNPILRSKYIELTKIEIFEREINDQLMNVVKSFPSFDNLSEFYQEMIDLTIGYVDLKKALASLKWCTEKNKELLTFYKNKNFLNKIKCYKNKRV